LEKDDNELKRIVHKINAIVYRELYQLFLSNITRTKCDIEYIFQITNKIKESYFLTIALGSAVTGSKRWLSFLEFELQTLKDKKIIPEELFILHKKQIQEFRDQYLTIAKINTRKIGIEYV
jgi:hypothetical protein